MSVASLLIKAGSEGVRVSLETGNKLKAYGPAEARAKWLPIFRQHKPALLAELTRGRLTPSRPPLRQSREGGGVNDPACPPNILSFEERSAAVEAIYSQMEAERERRRDWHAQPVEGWREGRLTIRNIVRDETVVIDFRKWRSGR
jgi:hypothetical protein